MTWLPWYFCLFFVFLTWQLSLVFLEIKVEFWFGNWLAKGWTENFRYFALCFKHYVYIYSGVYKSNMLLTGSFHFWSLPLFFKVNSDIEIVTVVFVDRTGIPAQINGVAALRHNWQHQVYHIFISVFILLLLGVVFSEELFVAAGAHDVLVYGLTRLGCFSILRLAASNRATLEI